ncbi:MAG: Zn-binding domain-containing protein, partial [Eubacterium sp.]
TFFNLIKAQFQTEEPIEGKPVELYPNEGRKALLFSDSRQRAARLARDMSQASHDQIMLQLFVTAIHTMEKEEEPYPLDKIYAYILVEASKNHLWLFDNESADKFKNDCLEIQKVIERAKKRGRHPSYGKNMTGHAPNQMLEHFLHVYCGGYNTLYDTALGWLEPMPEALDDALDILEEAGILVDEKTVLEVFNAWAMDILNHSGALGQSIANERRDEVLSSYTQFGLKWDWKFKKIVKKAMGWGKKDSPERFWVKAFTECFLSSNREGDRLFLDLQCTTPKFGEGHTWWRCKSCSELTAYPLRDFCPACGRDTLTAMSAEDYDAIAFWRKPALDALEGEPTYLIDTEEHTAQVSHKDQLDNTWSKTEEYEHRFQDLIRANERPVDILSSTTTMEVGIDIGSLVAIGLRNVPPMRENYQQRAGRAGRRGSSLSTVITYCENGPHDSLYYHEPAPMFRGEPRKPWIDVRNPKLLIRHHSMVILTQFLASNKMSMDTTDTISFFERYYDRFLKYLDGLVLDCGEELTHEIKNTLKLRLEKLCLKWQKHPELYEGTSYRKKTLLDSFFEEGIIPTFSFPKDVTSVYIQKPDGKLEYAVERGLDVAISEYAPGRSIVVDKKTYQIGGLYYQGAERWKGGLAAKNFMDDGNYVKTLYECPDCGWFGFADDLHNNHCPFCSHQIKRMLPMVRPWGFAPVNGKSISRTKLVEEYSYADNPEYSTVGGDDETKILEGYKYTKTSERRDQRIIMVNRGPGNKGFMICESCGAAFPGDTNLSFSTHNLEIGIPYRSDFRRTCRHPKTVHSILGYDFVTDMFVLEIALDSSQIDTNYGENPWVIRAGRSLSEAMRLQASKLMDIDFDELNAGHRIRNISDGICVDIYLYDNLSSGAGYATNISSQIHLLLEETEAFLSNCPDSCNSACSGCLKHYRNQQYHGQLDRFAALDLLRWAKSGILPDTLSIESQKRLISPLRRILETYGLELMDKNNNLIICLGEKSKKLTVYPEMWRYYAGQNEIAITRFEAIFARPYALEKIRSKMK